MSGALHLEGRDRGCAHLLEGAAQGSDAGNCVGILFSRLAAFAASVGVPQPHAYRKRPRPLLCWHVHVCFAIYHKTVVFSPVSFDYEFYSPCRPPSFVNNIWHEGFWVVISGEGREFGWVIVPALSSKELGMLLNVLQHTDRL